MYAIVKTGGKQYRVAPGNRVAVEKLSQAVGETIALGDVLFVDHGGQITVGQPTVAGASVSAEVVGHTQGPKVVVFKKRSKKGYKKTQGHRQQLTELQIKDIRIG